MANCQVKKGMFVLNECGNPAQAKCDVCGKTVCTKHAEKEEDQIICVECFAKQEFEETQNQKPNRRQRNKFFSQDRYLSDNLAMNSLMYYHWQSNMRHNFYHHHNHRPFDERDYSGFEEVNQTEFDDTNDTGGFFDS